LIGEWLLWVALLLTFMLKQQMDIEVPKMAATQLLDNYYQIHTSDLPTQKTKWQAEINRGFFLDILQEGEDSREWE
jgi:hypothetical protein